jgi:hypothetical protein
MNRYRSAAVALVTGAAGLSLAACSVGITSASATPSPTAVNGKNFTGITLTRQ